MSAQWVDIQYVFVYEANSNLVHMIMWEKKANYSPGKSRRLDTSRTNISAAILQRSKHLQIVSHTRRSVEKCRQESSTKLGMQNWSLEYRFCRRTLTSRSKGVQNRFGLERQSKASIQRLTMKCRRREGRPLGCPRAGGRTLAGTPRMKIHIRILF